MDTIDFSKLQNGSDIRGIALEGVTGESVNLTPEAVRTIGHAFVLWLKEQGVCHPLIMAGRDSRLSGENLTRHFIEGAYAGGARKVYDTGLSSTPAMFMSTVLGNDPADASVMITASHLPFNRNGLKFFTPQGGLDKGDISRILQLASGINNRDVSGCIQAETLPFIEQYSGYLVKYIREAAQLGEQPLQGMRIIVDAGNGAGGFFAGKVLSILGADTKGSQFLEPDGHFPNHIPNPEDPTAMQSVCEAVKKHKADLGVIFDTDVDRAAIVDSQGNPINRNSLIALISGIILREHPGSTIVTDSITSEGLSEFINNLGGVHHRYKRGYKNVINESVRINQEGGNSWLAIETSGHAALRENYFLDDGAFLVAKLLVEAARLHHESKNIADSIKLLRQPLEGHEFRYRILEEDFKSYGKMILNAIEEAAEQTEGWELVSPNFEGVRVKCNSAGQSGWFLLRMSLHDPVLPLNIESDVEGGVMNIYHQIQTFLSPYHLDCPK